MPVLVDDAVYDFARLEEVFPATVTITRTSEQDFKSRQLIVWVDGKRVASLLWGDSITCELQPGPHRLRISNNLYWKTVEFTSAPASRCSSRRSATWARAASSWSCFLGLALFT